FPEQRDRRPQTAADRSAVLRLRPRLRHGYLHALEEPSRPPLHARDLRTHLRNLQDLPHHAGEIPDAVVAFIAVIIALYFGWLKPVPGKSVALTLPIILLFSLVGIAGSYGVAWFGIRV